MYLASLLAINVLQSMGVASEATRDDSDYMYSAMKDALEKNFGGSITQVLDLVEALVAFTAHITTFCLNPRL